MSTPASLLTGPHRDLDLDVVEGHWPDDVSGEMVISAPDPDPALSFALFGFGVMIRCSLSPGTHGAGPDQLAWRHKVIDSPSRRLFEADPGLFTMGPLGWNTPLGAPNMGNTAPMPWGDRLLATWDVGRPIEVDPVTLGFLGEVGHIDSWGGPSIPMGEILPFVFSTAHPVVDPADDSLWSVKLVPDLNAGMVNQPWVIRARPDRDVVDAWPVEGARLDGSMHTITQTREWLVLVDSGNFKSDLGEMQGMERTVKIDERVPVFLVRKADLERTPSGTPVPMRQFEIAPPTGHFYAVYDDSDGIQVLFEHQDLMDLGMRLRQDDIDATGSPISPTAAGLYNMAMAPSTISEVRFHPETGATVRTASFRDDWTWNLQLSAMDWSVEGTTAPTLHHVLYQGCKPGHISKRALALYDDRVDPADVPTEDTSAFLTSFRRGGLDIASRYRFPDTTELPTSPIFIPRDPGGDAGRSRYAGRDPGGHDGYVALVVLADSGMRLELFDAGDVGAGPIAVATPADGATSPFLLHAAWMPAAAPAPDAPRVRFSTEADEKRLGSVDAAIAETTRAVARRLDDDPDG